MTDKEPNGLSIGSSCDELEDAFRKFGATITITMDKLDISANRLNLIYPDDDDTPHFRKRSHPRFQPQPKRPRR